MKRGFVSVIDGLHQLLAGEQEELPFRQKLRTVIAWFLVILFCLVMLKLMIP